jgi:amino-acid N-acetyltransferase
MVQATTVRRARFEDTVAISSILAANRDDPGLFQKSAAAVARVVGDFFVAQEETGRIVGCAGLHRDNYSLAEIYAVAVLPECQGCGVGRQLINACERAAVESGVRTVWLATVKPKYFCRFGFRAMTRSELPAAVLLRKLGLVFEQPVTRWLGAIFGRHTFMSHDIAAF